MINAFINTADECGGTTASLMLARTLARNGEKVLLISQNDYTDLFRFAGIDPKLSQGADNATLMVELIKNEALTAASLDEYCMILESNLFTIMLNDLLLSPEEVATLLKFVILNNQYTSVIVDLDLDQGFNDLFYTVIESAGIITWVHSQTPKCHQRHAEILGNLEEVINLDQHIQNHVISKYNAKAGSIAEWSKMMKLANRRNVCTISYNPDLMGHLERGKLNDVFVGVTNGHGEYLTLRKELRNVANLHLSAYDAKMKGGF